MSLNPLTIAHLGIARRPIVAALMGIWDELMNVLSAPETGGGGLARRARGGRWNPHIQPIAARHYDRDEEVLLLLV